MKPYRTFVENTNRALHSLPEAKGMTTGKSRNKDPNRPIGIYAPNGEWITDVRNAAEAQAFIKAKAQYDARGKEYRKSVAEACQQVGIAPQRLAEDPSTLNNLYTLMTAGGGGGAAIQGGLAGTLTLIGFIASLAGATYASMPGLQDLGRAAANGLLKRLRKFAPKISSGEPLSSSEKKEIRDTVSAAVGTS
jgi:hypothetical protein